MTIRRIALGLLFVCVGLLAARSSYLREEEERHGWKQSQDEWRKKEFHKLEEKWQRQENDFSPFDIEVQTRNWAFSEARITFVSQGKGKTQTVKLPHLRWKGDTARTVIRNVVPDRGFTMAVTAQSGSPLANFHYEMDFLPSHPNRIHLQIYSPEMVPYLAGTGKYGGRIGLWTDQTPKEGPPSWQAHLRRVRRHRITTF